MGEITVMLRMDESLLAALRAAAGRESVDPGTLVRAAVRRELARREKPSRRADHEDVPRLVARGPP
jgi:hypothetical protein